MSILGGIALKGAIGTIIKSLSPEQRESAKEMIGKFSSYLPMIPDDKMAFLYKEQYEGTDEESIFIALVDKEKVDVQATEKEVTVIDLGKLITETAEQM